MADSPTPKPPPIKPEAVPPPGSLPKLPQTIFNFEKKGADGGKENTRTRPRP